QETDCPIEKSVPGNALGSFDGNVQYVPHGMVGLRSMHTGPPEVGLTAAALPAYEAARCRPSRAAGGRMRQDRREQETQRDPAYAWPGFPPSARLFLNFVKRTNRSQSRIRGCSSPKWAMSLSRNVWASSVSSRLSSISARYSLSHAASGTW